MPNGWKLLLPDGGDADSEDAYFTALPVEVHEVIAGTLAAYFAEPPSALDDTVAPDDIPALWGMMPHDVTGGHVLS